MNRRKIGEKQEEAAAAYLEKEGYEILERNFWCRQGEIDIIARHKGYLVFVEVKYRKHTGSGFPEEAVNEKKQASMGKAARFYLYLHRCFLDTPCRFDVVSITDSDIRVIEDAFWL